MAAATSRTRIHVGGLGQSVSSDDLRKIFSAVGTVEGVDIVRTKGRSFAYVDIIPSSSNSISKLFSMYNGCAWKGGKLKLEKAKEHFLIRLNREWEETRAEAEEGKHQAKLCSLDSPNSKNKVHGFQNNHLRVFFPRLSKVKLLPFSGTGKHKYSFQRVETPALPIHFCDCEEHSGHFDAVKRKEVQCHEEINGGMNEEELGLMSSIMNKLFEREKVSNTSRPAIAKEKDDIIEPIEDSLSNEEENDDDDDDDLIINVVSNANSRTDMSREPGKIFTEKSRLGENKISKDGINPSAGKLQKKNALHPEKKRKQLPKKDDKGEIASVSPPVRRNSQFDQSEAGFEGNETDEDGLVINVASIANKGIGSSGSTKRAKVSSKQKLKSGESQTSEDGSVENYHEEKKDHLLPKKKMKLISAEERDGNEVDSTLPAEKGPIVAQSSTSWWSQKSSWKALVGDKGNSAFSLSNILQNVDTTKEKQHISDGPKVESTLDSKNEKLSTSENMEGVSGKTELLNVVPEAQPNQPSTALNNAGRGSSWLHKSSWIQLVSNKSNSFSISEILPGITTLQGDSKPIGEDALQSAAGNHSNIMEQYTASGVRQERDSVGSIPESNRQTIDGNKDASLQAVENISNSELDNSFGVGTSTGETCSFMRTSASLKEWAKTKAALKGSRKKKTKGDSM